MAQDEDNDRKTYNTENWKDELTQPQEKPGGDPMC